VPNPGSIIAGGFFTLLGVYLLLQGYGKVPPYKKMDSKKSKLWLQKYGRQIKIIGFFCLLYGLALLFGLTS